MTTTLSDVPYRLIRVRARDWSLIHDQYRAEGTWTPIVGCIAGWLIHESDDCIAISQQLFHKDGDEAHWDTRDTVIIPKETILEREDS